MFPFVLCLNKAFYPTNLGDNERFYKIFFRFSHTNAQLALEIIGQAWYT